MIDRLLQLVRVSLSHARLLKEVEVDLMERSRYLFPGSRSSCRLPVLDHPFLPAVDVSPAAEAPIPPLLQRMLLRAAVDDATTADPIDAGVKTAEAEAEGSRKNAITGFLQVPTEGAGSGCCAGAIERGRRRGRHVFFLKRRAQADVLPHLFHAASWP